MSLCNQWGCNRYPSNGVSSGLINPRGTPPVPHLVALGRAPLTSSERLTGALSNSLFSPEKMSWTPGLCFHWHRHPLQYIPSAFTYQQEESTLKWSEKPPGQVCPRLPAPKRKCGAHSGARSWPLFSARTSEAIAGHCLWTGSAGHFYRPGNHNAARFLGLSVHLSSIFSRQNLKSRRHFVFEPTHRCPPQVVGHPFLFPTLLPERGWGDDGMGTN